MAAFDYIESRYDADLLILEFGQTASLRRTTNSGTAWEPTQTTADSETYAVRVEFSQKQMANREILDTDSRWYFAAGPLALLGFTPAVSDLVVVGGVVLGRVLRCEPLSPAGVAVMFDVHVRV